jgi:cytochrome c6
MLDNIECGSSEAARGRGARLRIFAIILGAVVAVSVAGVGSRAAAKPAAAVPADAAGADVFKSNCVVCHGADGAGSPTGKALMAPDLHSDAVQKMTVAEMVTQVSDGKNNMPPFKNSLTKDQIAAVVTYVRTTFGKKK